jgi:hypothetical protein
MQRHGSRIRLDWPLLSQAELACNPMRKVILNSVEADQRARHLVQVFVCAAHGANSKQHHFIVVVWLPINLQKKAERMYVTTVNLHTY